MRTLRRIAAVRFGPGLVPTLVKHYGRSSARSDLAPCRNFSEGLLGDKNSKKNCDEFAWNEDIVIITMFLLRCLDFALPDSSF